MANDTPEDQEIAQAIRHPLWRAAMVLFVIAVLVTAVLGGFRQAKPRTGSKLPVLAPGVEVDAGRFLVSAEPGWTTDTAPGAAYPSDKESYLVIPLQVTNQGPNDFGAQIVLDSDLVLVMRGPNGQSSIPVVVDSLRRADSESFGVDLPPRLRVPVLAIWKRPLHASTPTAVEIGIIGREFVEQTFLTTESAWMPKGPLAKWHLPIRAKTETQATP